MVVDGHSLFNKQSFITYILFNASISFPSVHQKSSPRFTFSFIRIILIIHFLQLASVSIKGLVMETANFRCSLRFVTFGICLLSGCFEHAIAAVLSSRSLCRIGSRIVCSSSIQQLHKGATTSQTISGHYWDAIYDGHFKVPNVQEFRQLTMLKVLDRGQRSSQPTISQGSRVGKDCVYSGQGLRDRSECDT